MRYVNLGNTGLRVSRICLGMMSYGKHESREWALDEKAAEPIARRAVDIMASIDASLHDVVQAGKARYIGASSMYAWQFAKAQALASTRFVSMRNHYNLLYREEEREMIPQCIDQGVGVMPWSPLARGLLAGNRTREGDRLTTGANTDAFADSLYKPDTDFAVIDRAADVARRHGVPTAQVALAWVLHKPRGHGSDRGRHQARAHGDALAADKLSLSEADVRELEEPYVPHAIAGH